MNKWLKPFQQIHDVLRTSGQEITRGRALRLRDDLEIALMASMLVGAVVCFWWLAVAH